MSEKPLTSEGRPKQQRISKRNPGASSRTTIYLEEEIKSFIEEQARHERNSNSGFISDIMSVLLHGAVGQQLVQNARKQGRTLAQEIERNLILFADRVPTERIIELAEASDRTPDVMLVRLVLRGLEGYQQEEI